MIARLPLRFKHDCSNCVYLGRMGKEDAYFCSGENGGSVILRYGNKGEEYGSFPLSVALYSPCDSRNNLHKLAKEVVFMGLVSIRAKKGALKKFKSNF